MKAMNIPTRSILCIALGIIIGYALRSLFVPPLPVNIPQKQAAAILKAQQQQTKQYEAKMKTWTRSNDNLTTQLQTAKAALATTKRLRSKLRSTVQVAVAETPARDSSVRIAVCDSLKATVTALINADVQQDSCYEQVISVLQQQTVVKDSMINVQAQHNAGLQLSLDDAMGREQTLLVAAKALQRRIKKEQTKKKLFSAAMIVIGGAVVVGLLR